jgi:hypothetical protein
MSRPHRTRRPVISALALALLPLWSYALEAPAPAEPSLETRALQQSVVRRLEFADLLCTLCLPKPAVQLASPGNTNARIELNPYKRPQAERAELASAAVDDSRSARALGTLQFRDNQPLVNRLKRIQAWPLLTIWDSGAATLYVGVNRDGEPGVHLRQKRKDRGSLAPRSRLVLIASPATSGEPRVTAPRR